MAKVVHAKNEVYLVHKCLRYKIKLELAPYDHFSQHSVI